MLGLAICLQTGDSNLKKVFSLLLIVVAFFLTSCWQDTTQEAKEEFSKYFNKKNEVVLILHDHLYFEEYTLNIREKIKENEIEYISGTCVFLNGLVYFVAVKTSNMGLKIDSLCVYSCNAQGENVKLIYNKSGTYKNLKIVEQEDCYYIQYESEDITCIDKFTIKTKEYSNVIKGNSCEIKDILTVEENSKYKVETYVNRSPYEHGKYVVTNTESGETRIIDNEFLNKTIYIDSMKMFNYSPESYEISKGHILLSYSIGAGDGWNYSQLIFEYNFEKN